MSAFQTDAFQTDAFQQDGEVPVSSLAPWRTIRLGLALSLLLFLWG